VKTISIACFIVVAVTLAYSHKHPERKISKQNIEVPQIENPEKMDLTKNALFIDTTKTSIFHKRMEALNPSEWDYDEKEITIASKGIKQKIKSFNLNGFPNTLITLKKYNGEFILYDRCDGVGPLWGIYDSKFIKFGPLESWADPITEETFVTKDSIKFVINLYHNDPASIMVVKDSIPHVYKLVITMEGSSSFTYVTSIKEIKYFNLLVNHCVTGKRSEFYGFD
jgi:hypothetical protein